MGGGPHRSWPGERGRPRALIPGEGVREGLAWRGKATHHSWLGGRGIREAGQGLGGGGGARLRFRGGKW